LEPLSGYLTLGSRLMSEPALDGESFNFGPRSEQNNTVVQLLTDLAKIWGHNSPSSSYDIVDNIPFREASLLKLNIDKAMSALKWLPTLVYEECVEMTGSWYRDVVKFGGDANEITAAQIRSYEMLAQERHRVWIS
jgi:CDP-glucose 4,6-dehydratase